MIVIITGAGSGIGREFAIALLNDGQKVVLAGRTESTLRDTANIAEAGNENVLI